MSCVPYVWQYCWKEISAVAYIFYLVHCVLRHEITLHVLCRDKYSTSMQQFCHPGNNSYKQETIQFSGLYAHQRRRGPIKCEITRLFLFFFFFFLLRFGTSSNHGGILLPNPQAFSGISAKSPPQPDHAPPWGDQWLSGRVTSDQNLLNRRHRCHNTHERFGELFAAVPVLHIAKEALQFRYSTYRQID